MAGEKNLEKKICLHPLWGFLGRKKNGSYEYILEDCVIFIDKNKNALGIVIQTPEHYFHESYVEEENKHLKRGQKPLKKGYIVTQSIKYDLCSTKFTHGIDLKNFQAPLPNIKLDLNESNHCWIDNRQGLSESYASFIQNVLDGIFEKICPNRS